MRLSPLIHSLFVCALAAWMTLCCCEKRMLVAEVLGETAAASRDACCDDDSDKPACCRTARSNERSREHDRNCCKDACCMKAAFEAPPMHIDVDAIGVALPITMDVDARVASAFVAAQPAFDRSDGEPPPRLGLLTTARLRV